MHIPTDNINFLKRNFSHGSPAFMSESFCFKKNILLTNPYYRDVLYQDCLLNTKKDEEMFFLFPCRALLFHLCD